MTQMKDSTRVRRMLSRIEKKRGCWLYRGITKQGYAIVRQRKVYRTAHRVFYELIKGPVPRGKILDHLCRNRRCVNPKHLEPVTHRVNILRGQGAGARNFRKTHCKWGHPFRHRFPGSGYKYCRICLTRRAREWSKSRAKT